ncbi:MAG: phenylacetic acid degradation operon negative regulatory protein PaaX [Betaproteobacteria bacterium]|nr:phenylacetic acid degradation operon negative regulatory protein PaaX [Betaproteobacteria bacterium]
MSQEHSVSRRSRDPAVARWVARTLAADPPRAKSLLVTVWGDALAPHGGAVWLAALIRLLAPFGINDRLVRTSVFRLVRDGWLAASSHGRHSRYRLTRDGERRFDDAYRRIYHRPPEEWHGLWELVAAAGVPATRRAMLRDELAWTGFGELASGVFVRPHEPARPLPAIVAAPGIAGRVVVAQAGDLPGQPPLAAAAGRAWDLTVLAAEYRQFLHRFGAVIERFRAGEAHDPEQCFVVRTLLVHAYRRVLLRDPLLPAALLPLDWPGAAAHTLCRDFYRLTHRLAETHLAATLAGDGESLPPANAEFRARFGGL